MIRRLVTTCVLAACACPGAAAASQPVRDQYIVVLEPGSDAAAHARGLGVRPSHVYRSALRGYAAHIPPSRVAAVRGDHRVTSLSPVYPLDPVEAPGGATKHAAGQTLPTSIDRIDADVSSARSGDRTGALAGPAVAVLDGGIAPHPDLNVRGGVNCAPDAATNASWADTGGHGTHVAGTIAARDDSAGVVGVAPGLPLYAVRVVQSGAGAANTTAHALCGVDWINGHAAEYGIKVVNASLGYTTQFGWRGVDSGDCGAGQDALHQAICTTTGSGVTFVAAMGNATSDFRATAPAAFDEVLSVAAVADYNGQPGGGARKTCEKTSGEDDAAATFSNFTSIGSAGPDADWSHSIAAPGVCVTSDSLNGGMAILSGTSMAAPAVAGTVALCIAAGPCASLTPPQIIAKLRADAFARRTALTTYGFSGQPTADGTPTGATGSRYYGPLVYAGGY